MVPGLADAALTGMAERRTGRLVLTPENPESRPPIREIGALLKEIGLLGEPLDGSGAAGYLVGADFLRLISFMGCSPHIELTPPANGGSFCHLRLLGPHAEPQLLQGPDSRAPGCGNCGTRVPDWRNSLGSWCQTPLLPVFTCPTCGTTQRPLDLAWRQGAGWGSFFVCVEDIFPGEAVPVPSLLRTLERASGVAWRYFFHRD